MTPLEAADPQVWAALQQERLVMERNRVGRDYTVQAISRPSQTRDDIIAEIEARSEAGTMAVKAEIMYLTEFLQQVDEALREDQP